MEEAEFVGVQHEARGEFARFSVDWISKNGSPDVFEVHADLMGAASVQGALDEAGIVFLSSKNFVVSDGRFACSGVEHRHLLTIDGVATDVCKDGVFLFGWRACGDGVVDFGSSLALGKLSKQGLHRAVGLGDDDAARGVLIEAMHDAGALDAIDAGELAIAVMEEGVDEGAVRIAVSRVNDHAVRFVDDDEIVIFV